MITLTNITDQVLKNYAGDIVKETKTNGSLLNRFQSLTTSMLVKIHKQYQSILDEYEDMIIDKLITTQDNKMKTNNKIEPLIPLTTIGRIAGGLNIIEDIKKLKLKRDKTKDKEKIEDIDDRIKELEEKLKPFEAKRKRIMRDEIRKLLQTDEAIYGVAELLRNNKGDLVSKLFNEIKNIYDTLVDMDNEDIARTVETEYMIHHTAKLLNVNLNILFENLSEVVDTYNTKLDELELPGNKLDQYRTCIKKAWEKPYKADIADYIRYEKDFVSQIISNFESKLTGKVKKTKTRNEEKEKEKVAKRKQKEEQEAKIAKQKAEEKAKLVAEKKAKREAELEEARRIKQEQKEREQEEKKAERERLKQEKLEAKRAEQERKQKEAERKKKKILEERKKEAKEKKKEAEREKAKRDLERREREDADEYEEQKRGLDKLAKRKQKESKYVLSILDKGNDRYKITYDITKCNKAMKSYYFKDEVEMYDVIDNLFDLFEFVNYSAIDKAIMKAKPYSIRTREQ